MALEANACFNSTRFRLQPWREIGLNIGYKWRLIFSDLVAFKNRFGMDQEGCLIIRSGFGVCFLITYAGIRIGFFSLCRSRQRVGLIGFLSLLWREMEQQSGAYAQNHQPHIQQPPVLLQRKQHKIIDGLNGWMIRGHSERRQHQLKLGMIDFRQDNSKKRNKTDRASHAKKKFTKNFSEFHEWIEFLPAVFLP